MKIYIDEKNVQGVKTQCRMCVTVCVEDVITLEN